MAAPRIARAHPRSDVRRVRTCAGTRRPLSRHSTGTPARRWLRTASAELARALQRGYDLVIIVNPDSPTGKHVPAEALRGALEAAPPGTRVWIDETYLDYVGSSQSLERWAASSRNAVVCKSMSKAYALSGARCAYLCGAPALIHGLTRLSPPWAVGLLAQIAACEALRNEAYYHDCWRTTTTSRVSRAIAPDARLERVTGLRELSPLGLPEYGPTAADFIAACRARGLYLRDVSAMSPRFDDRTLRIAVKDAATNQRMLEILRAVTADGVPWARRHSPARRSEPARHSRPPPSPVDGG